jgi:predicted metal-binding membrane protein
VKIEESAAVGCCRALMLLMFMVGAGSVGGMLLLGATMAAEKNMPFGRHLAAPLGGVLIAGATWIVVRHLWFGPL